TAYPPEEWATSAPTGTTSTLLMLVVVRYTVTGAWSRVPATDGCVSVTVTWIVALLAVPDATVPTEEIVPGVLALSGSVTVTVTATPTATSDSWAVLSGIVTTCWSEVAASTGLAPGPPRLPSTFVTRI